MKTKSNKIGKEYINFYSNADEWWVENGKYSILHQINRCKGHNICNYILNDNY